MESIPWVCCASGNVLFLKDGFPQRTLFLQPSLTSLNCHNFFSFPPTLPFVICHWSLLWSILWKSCWEVLRQHFHYSQCCGQELHTLEPTNVPRRAIFDTDALPGCGGVQADAMKDDLILKSAERDEEEYKLQMKEKADAQPGLLFNVCNLWILCKYICRYGAMY